ncbi:MAG: hypothetical protein A3I63_03175 [Betaproteobacteria bacterium RIFCSPLOWO2_02_FULL_66_14]|nr:MAG: hypothetical protein A3I63_03175 [Betaproteobacteria bacterium RIFCSPLOWO2_02_FULL_66_14]
MRDVAVGRCPHLVCGKCLHREGVAVERQKFDFEGFALLMHVHYYADISNNQIRACDRFGQYD